MEQQLQIMAIVFQRGKGQPRENGIIINNGDGPIIDMAGKVVNPPVWNWFDQASELSLVYKAEGEIPRKGRRK